MSSRMSIEQLALIITHRCNLACVHCLRGDSENVDMSAEVIDAIFKDVKHVMCLQIGGGEPLLALDTLEKVFDCVKKRGIIVDQCTMVINGTLYNERFESILKDFNEYINKTTGKRLSTMSVGFKVSDDVFHHEQIDTSPVKRQYYRNIEACAKSEFFYDVITDLNNLLVQGRLDRSSREEFMFATSITDGGIVCHHSICTDHYGPQVVVDALGNVSSSCDFSYDNIRGQYKLGNVLENNFSDILSSNSKLVPRRKFNIAKEYARLRHYGIKLPE